MDPEGPFEIEVEEEAPLSFADLMTPMVDMMFNLMIFFVCVTELKAGGIPINLPGAPGAPAVAVKPKDLIVIEVGKTNEIAINKKEYREKGSFELALAELIRTDGKDQSILLRGDRKTDYGNVARVLGTLNAAGLSKITLEIQKSDE